MGIILSGSCLCSLACIAGIESLFDLVVFSEAAHKKSVLCDDTVIAKRSSYLHTIRSGLNHSLKALHY